MKDAKARVQVYCDGACRGNPGPGGWGALLLHGDKEKELYGFKPHTTNNEMELTAAIEALKALTRHCDVTITTDSNYVVKGMKEWIHGWKKNNWRTSGKQPVKNQELWKALDEAASRHNVKWHWIKGHAGHPENERADKLANKGIDEGRG
ncbi:MAG: ribonuclease HI [Nitrospinae bacterium]|nr:ribonuclease HI [Nitrospinota bacterium]